ncbi:MAG TPA: SUMF1/EgtB/PvdO family nonheme iron enzyme [Promineifilum sp.]|nr:SUMF1/EgtB/PvdO family nonheme iron enzyme [Promineifilum sp.]
MTPTNPELRKFIVQFFSDEGLETLCFDYFPEAANEFGSGMSKNRKVIVLISHCERRDRLADLHAALMRERAEAWNRAFASSVDHERERQMPKSDRRIHEKTGIELIRIPAGPFLYGDDKRKIDLLEYWIGRYPATNAQFARFYRGTNPRATGRVKGPGRTRIGSDHWAGVKGADWHHPGGPTTSIEGKDDHPVVQVSWHDAKAFCDWAGLILSREEQWEKAARGTDGRIWPWGDDPPTVERCNFDRNVGDTTPVGKYSPQGDSPYGCADMAGNVLEWAASWYAQKLRPALRGGSWDCNDQDTRIACRGDDNPDHRGDNIGFRVAELLSDPDS